MLFVICLVVAIVTIILAFVFERNNHDLASLISGIIAVPTAFAAAIMLVVILLTLTGVPQTEAKWQEQYASLNTRIEEHMYYPWDRAQLIEEIQDWNKTFAAQERSHNDFWVGIFNPESIEGLDKIDLNRID